MKKNVVLIGMPGSGKSTVGVVLAKLLRYRFVDMDIVLQEQEKRLLSEIIADEGIDGFVAIENRVNAGIDVENTVIASGGSAVYGKEAMEHLKEIGIIVYLSLNYERLKSRLGDLRARGVVLKEGCTLRDLYEERKPLYEKYADIIVEENDMELIGTVNRIKEELERAKWFDL